MEGDFTECLGIGMEHRDDGTVKKIIAAAKMKECNPNKTPALTTALGSDAKGELWDQNHQDCTSIVGMLLCVFNDTRPDTTFAASQVAPCTARTSKGITCNSGQMHHASSSRNHQQRNHCETQWNI